MRILLYISAFCMKYEVAVPAFEELEKQGLPSSRQVDALPAFVPQECVVRCEFLAVEPVC